MLGPNDIEDWATSEEDVLRAEIRLSPAYRRFGAQRGAPVLDVDLAARVRAFTRDGGLSCEDLRLLLADLEAVDGAAGPPR